MNPVLLETANLDGLPPIVAGLVAFAFLIIVLGTIIAMGSGRPHSK
jgi:ABC-type phosphate transport system permease subunit